MELSADLGAVLTRIAEKHKALVAEHPYQTFLRQGVNPEQLDCLLANPCLLNFQSAAYEGVQISTLWWGFEIRFSGAFAQQLALNQKRASEVACVIASSQPELAPIAGLIGAGVLSACQQLTAHQANSGVNFTLTWECIANPSELASRLLPEATAKTG